MNSAEQGIYTCPMHPEVRQSGPGNCPKCGMALEPLTAASEEGENRELKDMTRRFWLSVALSVPLLLVAMGEYVPALSFDRFAGGRILSMFELAIGTPVILWGGWPFFVRGWQSVVYVPIT